MEQMTPEQQREILEAAAKSCGFKKWRVLTSGLFQVSNNENWNEAFAEWTYWDPITNPGDTAEMCAELEINHEHHSDYIQCLWAPQETYHVITMLKDHNNSRLKAWMHAATMVAAKIGDLK